MSELLRVDDLDGKAKYQLLTSLVVPRPIGWVSTRALDGALNLAPFSFFGAIAPSPMLVSLSIGTRKGEAKDSLQNIRDTGEFCVNVVTERQLEQMNMTAGEYPPDVDEFEAAGLTPAEAESVNAPYVSDCPAVFECRTFREIELAPKVALVVGEVVGIRLDPALELIDGHHVPTDALRPVARLWGPAYGLMGEERIVERPK